MELLVLFWNPWFRGGSFINYSLVARFLGKLGIILGFNPFPFLKGPFLLRASFLLKPISLFKGLIFQPNQGT